MTAARPIGERITSVCQVLEKTGPSGIAGLRKKFPEMEPSNLFKYCNKAVAHGLVEVDDSGTRRLYTVKPEWSAIIKTRNLKKVPPPVVKPIVIKYKGPILTRWVGPMSHLNEVRV